MKRRKLLKIAAGATVASFSHTGLSLSLPSAAGASTATNPSNIPTLPQQDTLLGRISRQSELAARRTEYVWTEQPINLKGVPMAHLLPLAELPTIEWLLQAVLLVADVLLNVLASLPHLLDPAPTAWLDGQRQSLARSRQALQQAQADYQRLLAQPGTGNDPSVLAELATLRASITLANTQLLAIKDSVLAQLNGRSDVDLLLNGRADSDVAGYDALFVTLPKPALENDFREDDTFAYLRVGGANPVLIRGVQSLPAKLPLSDAQYRHVMGSDDSLAQAGAEGRLYLVDYAELSLMTPPGPIHKLSGSSHYAYAPIALFARPRDGDGLRPVAIQCNQDPALGPIFQPASLGSGDDSAYWAWQMAKTVVQNADLNHHEMCTHLANTHLVVEAFCVATHRQLAPTHPLNLLLAPHMEGSVFINLIAALIIMTPLTFADLILAAPIEDTQKQVVANRLSFDFYARMLPRDLRERRVEDPAKLPEYPYRDDGLLVWQAIDQWVREYLAVYYTSDADVLNDSELAAWADELATQGRITGFRRIVDREQLAEVLTMVIFTASAQHAAVNFPQRSMLSYVPAYAGDQGAPAPTGTIGQDEAKWRALLPAMALSSLAQLNFLSLLGSLYYRPLGDYRTNNFPYAPSFSDPRITAPGGPLQSFRQQLAQVDASIVLRNQQRRRSYEYLRPSLIPTSTNI